MYRTSIAILFSCFLLGSAWGADRLAVVEPAAKGGVSAEEIGVFWGMLESSVGGEYEVISRAALKPLLTEIGFVENSGLTGEDAKQTARSGEIKTVKYILVSTLGKLGTRFNLTLSLIDASTGQIIPGRRATDSIQSLDELSSRLPGLLREIGLGEEAKVRGIYAMLSPVITAKNPPSYLSGSFASELERVLLENKIRLRGLKTIDPILRQNGIGALDAADPALFAKVGELLKVDELIMPQINRFTVTEKKEYIAASKRNVVRRICDFDGEIRVLSAASGEITAVIPFRQKLNLDDVEANEDTEDWTGEDYGKYAIEQIIPLVSAKLLKALGK